MNKKYIDFVPTKKSQSTAPQTRAPRPDSRTAVVARTTVTRTTVTDFAAVSTPKTAPAPTPTPAPAPVRRVARAPRVEVVAPAVKKTPTDKTPPMGVVEDLNAHFITRDVPKRALGVHPTTNPVAVAPPVENTAAMAKQQKIKAKSAIRPFSRAKKPTSQPSKPVEKPVENSVYKTPKSPFINQNKVVKRPLSGNIYKKQIIEAVKEEPKGPVTIIAKPEKDKHIGIIVTIIITIILGAAAGTVAFLLLPK